MQSFCRILEAAVSDGGDMLTLHLDHLLNDLYDKVTTCSFFEKLIQLYNISHLNFAVFSNFDR